MKENKDIHYIYIFIYVKQCLLIHRHLPNDTHSSTGAWLFFVFLMDVSFTWKASPNKTHILFRLDSLTLTSIYAPPLPIMWAIDQYNSTEIKIVLAQEGLLEMLRYNKSITMEWKWSKSVGWRKIGCYAALPALFSALALHSRDESKKRKKKKITDCSVRQLRYEKRLMWWRAGLRLP